MDLSIETASDDTGVALSRDGEVIRAETWATRQNHSVELLPAIDRLLREGGWTKADVRAVFVDVGPGSYAGLRVGVSIAKAMAHGLGVRVAGIGRLELDAYAVAGEAAGRRIVAVHGAGRGETAWAAYRGGEAWREELAPRMSKPAELHEAIAHDDVVAGDVDEELKAVLAAKGATEAWPAQHRVVSLAALGRRRLDAGRADDPGALVPLYLRGPAIGPQRA